jgi:hypothetical protein
LAGGALGLPRYPVRLQSFVRADQVAESNTTPRPGNGTVVRAVTPTGQKGYLHHGGYFVGASDAWIMPADKALAEGRRIARTANVDANTVELVDVVGGQLDEQSARPLPADADDAAYAELAAALLALPERDLASVLKVLDDDAFRALRAAGIKMSGISAAVPPRHETGSLT